MTLIKTINQFIFRNIRIFKKKVSFKISKEINPFRIDCEEMVERYNSFLKEISSHMKEHNKLQELELKKKEMNLAYNDTDSFYFISIKEDLTILTSDCKQLLEKVSKNYDESDQYNKAIKENLDQLNKLHQYSIQIKNILHEYEKKVMKMEEEISNNTLCS